MAEGLGVEATLLRAEQLLAAGRAVEAEDLAGRALAEDPESPRALKLMARSLRRQERSEEAVPLARQALAQSSGDLDALLVLADALVGAGEYVEAQRVATAAVEAWPHAWQSHYSLSQALGSGRRAGRTEAMAAARRAQDLAPHVADTHNLVGINHLNARSHQEAATAFRAALSLNPQHPMAMNNLAVVQLRRRRLGKAGRGLTGALSASPQTPLLRRNLDLLVTNVIWRMFVVLWLAGRVVNLMRDSGASREARLVAWAILMVVVGGCWWWLSRSLPRGVRRIRDIMANSTWLSRALLAIEGLLCLVLLVESLSTREVADLAGRMQPVLLLTGFVCLFVVVGQRIAYRRSHPGR